MNQGVKYGFLKPAIDAHTLGILSAAELLHSCNFDAVVAGETVSKALSNFRDETQRKVVIDWIVKSKISRLGISYRLDPKDAANMMGYLIATLRKTNLMKFQGGQIETIYFGGLQKACALIEKEHKGLVKTFVGGESVKETLIKLGVPEYKIPPDIRESSKYDDSLLEFGKEIVDTQDYLSCKPKDRSGYEEYGTATDNITARIAANKHHFAPLTRAHVGPYSSALTRWESIDKFMLWAKTLAQSNYLDILSIGSSQLTQSNFGEDWGSRTNGGGVPINSPEEYRMIWEVSRPLLVRTYAGTKNMLSLAQIHEHTLNICWHALSLWWFCKLDGRGPYDVYTNLTQQIKTIKYIAKTGKPYEANVSHHFAFRGADDVTYLVSAYLAAKLAKLLGIKTFILQNMLNTPRMTWGIHDLAKSRALIGLIGKLEEANFKVIFQPRAGLDFFKPDLYEARIQLAAVTALMDDIDPHNEMSPPLIHVVSYSEATDLATPEIVIESIQIAQHSLQKFRTARKEGKVEDMNEHAEVNLRAAELYKSAKEIISAIETYIDHPYSAEGFYKIFAAGFLPVPYLWGETEEFKHAKNWQTKLVKGGVQVVDDNSNPVKPDKIIDVALSNLKDAEYNLKKRF